MDQNRHRRPLTESFAPPTEEMTAVKYYLYTDFSHGPRWATNPTAYRAATGSRSKIVLRVANINHDYVPPGYVRTGDGLANDPIVRVNSCEAPAL